MHDADHLAALVAANEILRSTDPADLDRAVPSCPGWTVEDLVDPHRPGAALGHPHRHRAAGREGRRGGSSPARGPAIIDWFGDGADALIDGVRHRRPRPRGLRVRRDPARRGGGSGARPTRRSCTPGTASTPPARPTAIDPAVASDGIDELLTEFLGPRLVDTSAFAAAGETIHVHTTDVDGEWLVRIAPDQIDVTREHAKGDVALRGPAADLLLTLFDRQPGRRRPTPRCSARPTLLDRLVANATF